MAAAVRGCRPRVDSSARWLGTVFQSVKAGEEFPYFLLVHRRAVGIQVCRVARAESGFEASDLVQRRDESGGFCSLRIGISFAMTALYDARGGFEGVCFEGRLVNRLGAIDAMTSLAASRSSRLRLRASPERRPSSAARSRVRITEDCIVGHGSPAHESNTSRNSSASSSLSGRRRPRSRHAPRRL